MFEKKSDGTYRFSRRFWVYTTIATLIICWIGWRTQDTADRVDEQVAYNSEFVINTNECLQQVVSVLTTRVGYNERIAELDSRRQKVWEQLVANLAASDNSAGLNQAALTDFQKELADINADQAETAKLRAENQYPQCAFKGSEPATPEPPK
ncbi:hypothetical protein KHO57_gp081 [Mycobacterium phage Phabba]|uniref:Uncharacterized protein n=1 Tax=Mycobacterium phage Phabba TaxID=2027899 RepID=A0A249XSI0_9CAUD|nr:hypothetical protein KHO57_gp081 [Mycobacterium phage Phabba]ASZ74656.1 hypothetical protein SEA_PHABBA_81 [Mycobacterium phage Phabba]